MKTLCDFFIALTGNPQVYLLLNDTLIARTDILDLIQLSCSHSRNQQYLTSY
jgi:hypothetical protein